MCGFRMLRVILLVLCLADASGRLREVEVLQEAVSMVRAVMLAAAQPPSPSSNSELTEALQALVQRSKAFPRWALLHAVAEERERLSWRQDRSRIRHAHRAACLYSAALKSSELDRISAKEFSDLFGRTARSIPQLLALARQPVASVGDGAEGTCRGAEECSEVQAFVGSDEEALQAQEKQCAATLIESERWVEKRHAVQQFIRGSVFDPLRWVPTLRSRAAVEESIRRGASALHSEELLQRLEAEVSRRWTHFSADGAGEALRSNAGTDLRAVLARHHAVPLFHSPSSRSSLLLLLR